MLRVLLVTVTCTLAGGCLNLGTNVVEVPLSKNTDFGSANASNTIDPSIKVSSPLKHPVLAAAAFPSHDLEGGCKRSDLSVDETRTKDCLRLESEAKLKLTQEWKSHSLAERQDCAAGLAGESYVEVMTCLEIKDWAKQPDQIGGVTGNAVSPLASKMSQPDPEKAAVVSH
jgi:hypothetical protein